MDAGRVRPRTPGQGLAAPWIPANMIPSHAQRSLSCLWLTSRPLVTEA